MNFQVDRSRPYKFLNVLPDCYVVQKTFGNEYNRLVSFLCDLTFTFSFSSSNCTKRSSDGAPLLTVSFTCKIVNIHTVIRIVERLILQEGNPMSLVSQNINPHPLSAQRVCNSRLCCGGRTQSPVWFIVCAFRVECCAKDIGQRVQLNGLSSVWILKWLTTHEFRWICKGLLTQWTT